MTDTNSISSKEIKQCSNCKTPKPVAEFYMQRGKPCSRCKACHYEASKPSTKHYQQKVTARRHSRVILGKYRKLPTLSPSDIERFWHSIDKRSPEECWPWKGYQQGYGKFSVDGVKWRAHRLVWLLTTGEDPGELLVRHAVCENPICCNFAHLATGTEKELNDDDVRLIRLLYANHEVTQYELAARFDVRQSLISHIIRRRIWKQVE